MHSVIRYVAMRLLLTSTSWCVLNNYVFFQKCEQRINDIVIRRHNKVCHTKWEIDCSVCGMFLIVIRRHNNVCHAKWEIYCSVC